MERLTAYSDGASRGNPGKAAIGIVLLGEKKTVLYEHREYIGVATNNQAEYRAVIKALEIARQYQAKVVDCYMDSELLVKQLKGEYRTRNPGLKKLKDEIKEKERAFQRVTYNHVGRGDAYIERCDHLANRALNEK